MWQVITLRDSGKIYKFDGGMNSFSLSSFFLTKRIIHLMNSVSEKNGQVRNGLYEHNEAFLEK